MSETVDDICAYADARLNGSGLTFALVLWKPGQAGEPKSVGLAAPPQRQAEAPLALRTTADCADPAGRRPDWRPIEEAPKDGTLLLLLVDYSGDQAGAPLEDDTLARTIGANNFDNDGEDAWRFAGWCWSHDHYTEGQRRPVKFILLDDVAPTPPGPLVQAAEA